MIGKRQRQAQGDAAEALFRAWLERCHLPHIYVEQSPFTFPSHLKGEIKRPDFLVGIPAIGSIAVDVKAKRIYDNCLLIDAEEHRTLATFETCFSTAVWFACFPPEEAHSCYLMLNREIADLAPIRARGKAVLAVPLRRSLRCDHRRDFMAALVQATRVRS